MSRVRSSTSRNGFLRGMVAAGAAIALVAAFAVPALGRDRPFATSRLFLEKWAPTLSEFDGAAAGQTDSGGPFSVRQITGFRCRSAGDPAATVDMSCNTTTYGQNYAPDNEITVAVNPYVSSNVIAGSNDYFYRFNNSTGTRQAIVPTGFFTSFDGGAHWLDGEIPMRTGNGAGDPSVTFVRKFTSPTDAHNARAVMAQLENVGGQGGPYVSQGDVSVSVSADGGETWSAPQTVFMGAGTGIGPANQAVFWDKEWVTANNYPGTPGYGRVVVTATKFVNGLHGSYESSAIWMSYSDDGGITWSAPASISGSNAAYCTFQSAGPAGVCDEDQFSIPEFAPDGTLYVEFVNGQNDAAWEVADDLDSQLMVVAAPPSLGAPSFGAPVHIVDLEDGFSDMPSSVIRRQTVWGHQIRWASAGNVSVNPTNPLDLVVTWSDRGTANANATARCFLTASGGLNIGTAPTYDPCGAGPAAHIGVWMSRSTDGGSSWSSRRLVSAAAGAQWFPWADHKPDGTLVVAWDEDTSTAPADTFRHVLFTLGSTPVKETLGVDEHIDESVTHWAGQYTSAWPGVCGPAGYSDGPIADAAGKDCNVFHGDYTGLAIGSDGSINVVWTGLNRRTVSPQVDFYLGTPHDGYAQDAMFARR